MYGDRGGRSRKRKTVPAINWNAVIWPTGLREWEKPNATPIEGIELEAATGGASMASAKPIAPEEARAFIRSLAPQKAALGTMNLSSLIRDHEQYLRFEQERTERARRIEEEEELLLLIGIIEQ